MSGRPRLSTLELRPAVSRREWIEGNLVRHPELHFLDFVTDGVSFREAITGAEDQVTELNPSWLGGVQNTVNVLLGRGAPDYDLGPGRIALLVCAVEQELTCGAVTVQLSLTETEVTWSDLRWEDGFRASAPVESPIDSLTFDRNQYEQVLAQAYELVAAFPYDKLEHRGRRFLWPWQWGWGKFPSSDQKPSSHDG